MKVEKTASVYSACFEPTKGFAAQARLLAEMHVAIMDEAHVRLCSEGRRRLQAGTDRIKLNTIFTALAVLLGVLAVVTAQSHAAARAPETYSDSPQLYRS